jgi:DNA repair protein RAD16
MGKTIQTVALLATDTTRVAGEAGTLVVAPAVAIIQWKNEIEKYTNSALSVHIYHGSSRSTNLATMKQYDVVLTTYNLLESCYRKQQSGFRRKNGVVKEKSFLHGIDWHRVVLDEAHCIKDRACNTARAIFALQTERRLCLSGTPLQNRVGELFSLLRFLKADPFSYYYCKKCPCKSLSWKFKDGRTCDDCGHSPMTHTNWFNHELLKPIQRFGATGEGRVAFSKIHQLLGKLMLRRTKVERADDMGLPPRVEIIRRDMFNPEELDLYESLYTGAKRQFSGYVAQGVLLNSYANVFQLITRLRQMADHPDLVLRRIDMQAENNLVCRLCDDVAEDCIAAKCKHHFCRVCVTEFIDTCLAVPECPVCNTALSIDLTAPGLEPPDEERMKKSNILNRIDMTKWKSSTKIEALVEELYKLRSTHSSTKSIVFSQFTSFLELIAFRLRKAGFNTCKLDGSMTPEQRHNTIVKFSTDIQFPVFLVSLKAGGVALNLTEASTVFLVDSWWSPSAEWQAADRIHRLGQYRPVAIKRIVIANSIEERIVELQAKKVNMIKSTLDHDATSLDRLNQEDMEFLFT